MVFLRFLAITCRFLSGHAWCRRRLWFVSIRP
jgi:hypothetical protein